MEKDLEKDLRFCVGFLCWIFVLEKDLENVLENVLVPPTTILLCCKCLTHGRKEFIEHIRKRNNRLTSFSSADEMINPNPSFSDICHMIIEI